jgi:MarR family transcriptional regulator for hemolysin
MGRSKTKTMLDGMEETWLDSEGVNLPDTTNIPGASRNDVRDLRLGFLIHDVSRLRRKAFDQLMKPLGITRSQWWVIAHLSRHDGMMQSELATLLDVGKMALGGLVIRLEAGGWLIRKPDPADGRIKRVFLTSTSHGLIRKMQAAEKQHNKMVLKGLSQEERNFLIELMTRIKRNLSPE